MTSKCSSWNCFIKLLLRKYGMLVVLRAELGGGVTFDFVNVLKLETSVNVSGADITGVEVDDEKIFSTD